MNACLRGQFRGVMRVSMIKLNRSRINLLALTWSRGLLIFLMLVTVVLGSEYASERWVKWKINAAEKSAKSESKTYTTDKLAAYSNTFKMFESGLGTPDTFVVVSADSTDTAWFYWSLDTFWVETTDSVYIAKLMGADGTCMWNDSIPQVRARLDTVEAELDTALAKLDTLDFSGKIVLWSGAVGSIPAGWQLCNGTNGTPDLRDRFVVGAGNNYVVDSTGGAASHTHTINSESTHTHSIIWGACVMPPCLAEGGDWDRPLGTETGSAHTHTESTESNLPPFFALAYIMKL